MQDLNEMDDAFLPLRDVVFKKLRQEILLGELAPGERLMEIHLAQRLGVSRTPIREAIRKLELEGLVTMIPRRGAEVAQISEKNLEDVLEVRTALERLAVRLACERITPEQTAVLREAADRFAAATKTDQLIELAETDEAFHAAIYEATGNDRLVQMLNNIKDQMYRYRVEYLKDEKSHALLIDEHRTLCELLEKRDKDAAARMMQQHISRQEAYILEMLARENV